MSFLLGFTVGFLSYLERVLLVVVDHRLLCRRMTSGPELCAGIAHVSCFRRRGTGLRRLARAVQLNPQAVNGPALRPRLFPPASHPTARLVKRLAEGFGRKSN